VHFFYTFVLTCFIRSYTVSIIMKDKTTPQLHSLVRYSVLPSGEIEAVNDLTFDPDPESAWHCRGYGRTEQEALADLLDKLAEVKTCTA
jgi:hypothetical protein